jgi:hypothetical protein
VCQFRLPNISSFILTRCQVTDGQPEPALCQKLGHRPKLLKMFTFPAIIFQAVWYEECLSISRMKIPRRYEFEARITEKGDLTMYRKMFTGMICLMLLGGTFFVPKGGLTNQIRKPLSRSTNQFRFPGKCFPQAPTYSNCWIRTTPLSLQFTTLTRSI